MAKDKYGIPQPGGNNGPYVAKKWAGIDYALPWQELMAAIALAGFPQEYWGMAGAIAAAESSRNPFIYNTYKQGHFGLFQVSRAAWPDFFSESKNGGMSWISPELNAKQAYTIWKQQGWKAWQASTNGEYLAYYPRALNEAAKLMDKTKLHGGDEKGYWSSLQSQKTYGYLLKALGVSGQDLANAAGKGLTDAVTGGAGGVASGVTDSGGAVASTVADQWGWLTDVWTTLTTPAVWMRMAYGVTGIALTVGGLFLIVRNRPAVQQATKVAASVIPGGAAVSAVKGAGRK